jgi:hypothetical protein
MRLPFAILACAFLAGCDARSVVPVSGRITLNGQPLADAIVLFQPDLGRTNPGTGSIGRTDANGRFVLRQIQPDRRGALVGWHHVTIRSAPKGAESETKAERECIPENYNTKSGLGCFVPSGGCSDADFDLHSDGS